LLPFLSDILPIHHRGRRLPVRRLLKTTVKTLAHVVFYALVPCPVFNLLVTSRMSGGQLVVAACRDPWSR
jgi:hypothetical protein